MLIESKSWGVKEIITGVVLSLLTVVFMMAGSLLSSLNTYLMLYASGALGALLGGPLYALLITRVNRFGATAIFTTILSLTFLMQGGFFVFFVPIYLVLGLVLELIFLRTEAARKNPWRISLLWMVFCALYLLSTFVSFLDLNGYVEAIKARGMSDGFINTFLSIYTNPVQVLLIVLITLVAAFIGAQIGRGLMRRHFSKAGVL